MTPCVLWTGRVNASGYGVVWRDGRSQLAHRVAYAEQHGPIPAGLTVDHRCYTPSCINVDHMRLMTPEENLRHQRAASKTHCKNDHEFTPENTYWRPASSEGKRDCRTCIRDRVHKYTAKSRSAA